MREKIIGYEVRLWLGPEDGPGTRVAFFRVVDGNRRRAYRLAKAMEDMSCPDICYLAKAVYEGDGEDDPHPPPKPGHCCICGASEEEWELSEESEGMPPWLMSIGKLYCLACESERPTERAV